MQLAIRKVYNIQKKSRFTMLNNSEFKIFIIDDELSNIETAIHFLKDDAYNITYNTSSKAALKHIFEEDFDLILLDISMPELNGIEFCEKIKNNEKTKDIPIIFSSVLSDTITITNAFSSGGVDYIRKPFNNLELSARVKTQIKLRKYIKELQSKQEKLAQIVATDTQTGLANRLRFLSILKKNTILVKKNPSQLSMAYIKINNLSKINTIYGYKSGDKVLINIANNIKSLINTTDILARMFGSGFVLLMPNTSLESASILSKKILKIIRSTESPSFKIICSIGVGEYKLGEKYEDFIHRVEGLMEEVATNGGYMVED